MNANCSVDTCLSNQFHRHHTTASKYFPFFQRRLAEYGFAARYKGPIGRKAVEEKKRSVSLETEELYSDSGKEISSTLIRLINLKTHR